MVANQINAQYETKPGRWICHASVDVREIDSDDMIQVRQTVTVSGARAGFTNLTFPIKLHTKVFKPKPTALLSISIPKVVSREVRSPGITHCTDNS